MKLFVVLALVAVALARPGPSKDGRGREGQNGAEEEFSLEDLAKVKPVGVEDLKEVLKEAKQFSADARGHFETLKAEADKLGDSDEDLDQLGQNAGKLVETLEQFDNERTAKLGGLWMEKIVRLSIAGVEGEGQCHKMMEFLIKAYMSYKESSGKRQMSDEERQFWQGVAKAGMAEVACIIGRFKEFEGLVEKVGSYLEGEKREEDPEGYAFKAEVALGSLYFGYQHVRRQVEVFVGVVKGLSEGAEQQAGGRDVNSLRSLVKEAEALRSALDKMEKVKSLSSRKLF